jgi:hypothetical protein
MAAVARAHEDGPLGPVSRPRHNDPVVRNYRADLRQRGNAIKTSKSRTIDPPTDPSNDASLDRHDHGHTLPRYRLPSLTAPHVNGSEHQ